jgi:predicted RNA-binding Zn ribbon-like protein
LDFINTLDNRFAPSGPVELLNSFEDLVRFAVQAELMPEDRGRTLLSRTSKKSADSLLAAALLLREALARIFYAATEGKSPKATDLEELSRIIASGLGHRKLGWTDSGAHWAWQGFDDASLLWRLALDAATLLTSEDMQLLKVCGAETCRWLFLDTSRNHLRRWCDMKVCGNRVKARRYYRRTEKEPRRAAQK